MSIQSVIHRYLDPGDTLSELLFGLIMVLSFTLGSRILIPREELDTSEVILAAVACNIAWGMIDAVLYLLGTLFERRRRARFFRMVKSAKDETEAMAIVQEEFGLEDQPLDIAAEDRAGLYRSILALSVHATPARMGLKQDDFVAAFVVFLLVTATALPAVVPFLLLGNTFLALRLSNLLLTILLFIVGYRWARHTDVSPWRVGLTIMILGVSMVGVAIALGG
jgi:VIT1/CCC1 family predicted Fe2+/Mn2+ transporter